LTQTSIAPAARAAVGCEALTTRNDAVVGDPPLDEPALVPLELPALEVAPALEPPSVAPLVAPPVELAPVSTQTFPEHSSEARQSELLVHLPPKPLVAEVTLQPPTTSAAADNRVTILFITAPEK
jgi:hypothetical protein